ncbi:Spy/CpxP family protein refolding chaperone [Ramlibacter sp. AN1133]|uniref:Spy/CpxP family protein refolding chaperone n=1 Tax=Ramlibacter sp. AN1133 TaxID=3133429 RepID=UPI0030C15F9D
MKTTTKILAAVTATAALALAGAAFGHPGFGPGGGPGFGMGPGMMGGYGPGMMGGGPGMMGGYGPGMMGGGPGTMGGYGPGMMGFGGADMGAATASRLAALKSQLKITPAQESAWKAYESTVTQQATAMQALRDKFHAQWQNAKPGEAAPDMAAHRQEMFAARESAWQAQEKARTDLFAALTPEQQALAGGGWGPRGWRHR